MRYGYFVFGLLFPLLVCCAVGPNYQSPPRKQHESWGNRTTRLKLDTGPVTRWWTVFDDDQLNQLIHRTARDNFRLKSARARVRAARALRDVSAGGYYPSLETRARHVRSRSSKNDPRGLADLVRVGLADLENDLFEGSFDASWEVDVFGHVSRRVESAQANYQAMQAERRDILVSVLAEVARNYVELRGFQARRHWLNRRISFQSALVDLLKSNRKHGLISERRVLQAQATLSKLRSRRPSLKTSIKATVHRLSVLAGTEPKALNVRLQSSQPLSVPDGPVPVGLPSKLLRRRPDVRRAERRLAEATAEIGVASANLFPRFFLTGSAGRTSESFSTLFESASRTWSFGPSVQWSIFQGGRIRARIEAAEENKKAALAQYRGTVLRVLEDVESSLVRYGQSVETLDHRRDEVQSLKVSLERTRTNENVGLDSRIDLIQDRLAWSRAKQTMVERKTKVQLNLIRLYKALGGGWKPFASYPDRPNKTDRDGADQGL